MRKNKKRKSLSEASDSRTYTMVLKNTDQYCYICCRRAGVYHAYCGPEGNSKGRGKQIMEKPSREPMERIRWSLSSMD